MADLTINQLTEDTSPTTDDYIPAWDVGTGTSKKVSLANVNASDAVSKAGFLFDFVESGCVWTADSVGVNLNASMTSGVVWLSGKRLTVAAVTARAFTTNVDTYIDLSDNGDGTGLLAYDEEATNAASPALAAGSIRIGIIQAAATITATTKVNQGQETKVFPIASSIPYAVTDSLGNLICPRDPNRKTLGYRQAITNQASTSTTNTATILQVPYIVPIGRKVKYTAYSATFPVNASATTSRIRLFDGAGTGGTQLQAATASTFAANVGVPVLTEVIYTPSAASNTVSAGVQADAGTATWTCGSTLPGWLKVELI